MNKILLSFFLLFIVKTGYSQVSAVDSLIKALSLTKEDTIKVKTLNLIAKNLWQTSDFHNAMSYASDALKLGEKINYKKGISVSDNILGLIYTELGNYPDALKMHLAFLKLMEETGDKKGIAISYGNIANIYFQQKKYSEALSNSLTALKIEEEISDKKVMATTLNNIGNTYSQLGDRLNDLKSYEASLKIEKELGDKPGIVRSYNNIGNRYEELGQYPEALDKYLAALKLENEIGDKKPIAALNLNLGYLYIQLHNFSEARQHLNTGLQLSKEIGSKEAMVQCYYNLALLDSISENFKEAFQYRGLYSQVKESMLNEESDKQVSQLKIQYETEKKEREIMLLNKNDEIKTIKIEKQKATVRYLIGGFVILIFFAAVAFWLYNQKRKIAFKHEILETKMTALRSQMNPHFTFNVLNSIQYYAGENDMKSVQHYLRQFSKLIRMVLDQSRTSYITLEQEISLLKLYLELEEMRFEEKFKYSIECTLDEPELKKILIPGMLIQPLVENAIKHGIEHKEGEALINIFFNLQNSILICKVKDNGIGRAEAMRLKSGDDTHISAATSILKERMEALSSIYDIHLECITEDLFDNEGKSNGTCVTMQIPIKTET